MYMYKYMQIHIEQYILKKKSYIKRWNKKRNNYTIMNDNMKMKNTEYKMKRRNCVYCKRK